MFLLCLSLCWCTFICQRRRFRSLIFNSRKARLQKHVFFCKGTFSVEKKIGILFPYICNATGEASWALRAKNNVNIELLHFSFISSSCILEIFVINVMTELSQSGSKRLILYPSSIIRDWKSICCKSCNSISETFSKDVNLIKN